MADKADFIVVGAGTAGIPAAVFAAQQGAKVILVEAAPDIGGALHLSSGTMSAAGGRLQEAKGIVDSVQSFHEDSQRISHGTSRPDLLKLWQENAVDTLHWLLDTGLTFPENQPSLALGHDAYAQPRLYTPANGGLDYLKVLRSELDKAVARGQVDLRLSTRMTDLEIDNGRVVGVWADAGQGAQLIRADNVLLATGGYGCSEQLWRELHDRPVRTHTYEWCQGDAYKLARKKGLATAYAEQYMPTVGGTVDIDNPRSYWIHTMIAPAVRDPWEIMVNLNGDRFMAEDIESPDFRERMLLMQPDMAFWVVWDEGIREAAPPLFRWPQEKVDRAFASHPDFQKADSVEQLAVQCGLDPDKLKVTIEHYNAGVAVGSDAMRREHLPAPIVRGPFYAVKHHATAAVTYAGVKTNDRLEVLTDAGVPVKGLYAAGEVLGMGAWGNCHLGGVTISSSLTFGRLLGEKIGSLQTAR